jgi:23S rRNA (guanosine2251-2'-O)-methyltransferase
MSDVVGIQAVRAVLRESPQRARALFVLRGRRDARINELIDMAKRAGVRHQSVDGVWFRRRAGDTSHQGVLLETHELSLAKEADLFARWDTLGPQPLLLVLDGITDPRNFGACLRSASGAGVDAVIVPKRNSAPLSPVALKTAQGGAEDLFIVEVTNLARTLKALAERGVWIIGTDGEATAQYTQMDANSAVALVMGSEDKGMRRLTRELCDQVVFIPMQGSVASLNVSVAAGIMLYEVRRQRDCGLRQ